MQIKKIKYSVGRVINLGNFENIKIDVGAEALLDDSDDIEESYQAIKEWAEQQIESRRKELLVGEDD